MTELQADAATERERELAAQVERGERKITDLRSRIDGLEMSDLGGEVVFQHIRTRRNLVTIYSMVDGEPIQIPEYMVEAAMSKTLPDGGPMFTNDAADAPEYKLGQTKCFLHPDSPDRPILERAGLAGKTCVAGNLAGGYAKRIHALHRHKQEWEAYQDYVGGQEAAQAVGRAEQQIEATLALARRADGSATAEVVAPRRSAQGDTPPVEAPVEANACSLCGWKPKPGNKSPELALRFHRVGKHGV